MISYLIFWSTFVSSSQSPCNHQNRLDSTQTPIIVVLKEKGEIWRSVKMRMHELTHIISYHIIMHSADNNFNVLLLLSRGKLVLAHELQLLALIY